MSTTMTMTKSAQTDQNLETSARNPEIDRRYGKIGISAVAAAMRFQSDLNTGETRNTDSYRFEIYTRD